MLTCHVMVVHVYYRLHDLHVDANARLLKLEQTKISTPSDVTQLFPSDIARAENPVPKASQCHQPAAGIQGTCNDPTVAVVMHWAGGQHWRAVAVLSAAVGPRPPGSGCCTASTRRATAAEATRIRRRKPHHCPLITWSATWRRQWRRLPMMVMMTSAVTGWRL